MFDFATVHIAIKGVTAIFSSLAGRLGFGLLITLSGKVISLRLAIHISKAHPPVVLFHKPSDQQGCFARANVLFKPEKMIEKVINQP